MLVLPAAAQPPLFGPPLFSSTVPSMRYRRWARTLPRSGEGAAPERRPPKRTPPKRPGGASPHRMQPARAAAVCQAGSEAAKTEPLCSVHWLWPPTWFLPGCWLVGRRQIGRVVDSHFRVLPGAWSVRSRRQGHLRLEKHPPRSCKNLLVIDLESTKDKVEAQKDQHTHTSKCTHQPHATCPKQRTSDLCQHPRTAQGRWAAPARAHLEQQSRGWQRAAGLTSHIGGHADGVVRSGAAPGRQLFMGLRIFT
eukprot:COSAG04_NODE_4869_length_1851_cov_1.863014_1_plen_251_part_00